MSARRVDISIQPDDEIDVVTLETSSRPTAWITIESVAIWPETSAQADKLAAAVNEVAAFLKLIGR